MSLVYPEIQPGSQNQYTNVLLINRDSIKDHQIFVDSVNAATFPIVHSTRSTAKELMSLLRKLFTIIPRIGVAFATIKNAPFMFLDKLPLFAVGETEPFSENLQFIIQVIREFGVNHIDFLACDTLNDSKWVNYYEILKQQTGVTAGASNGKTGNIKYGGDWVMESTSQDIESIYFTKNIEYYSYLLDAFTASAPVGLTITPDGIMFIGNNYVLNELAYKGSIQKINLSTPTQIDYYWASMLDGIDINGPWGLAVDNGYLYVSNNNTSKITKISIVNPTTDYTNSWAQLSGSIIGITIVDGFAYVSCSSVGAVAKVSLSDPSVMDANWANSLQGITNPSAICNDGTWIYVANYDTFKICKISISDPQNTFNVNIFPALTSNALAGLTILNNYLYVACSDANKIARINLNDPTDYNVSWVNSSQNLRNPTGLAVYNNELFVNLNGNSVALNIPLTYQATSTVVNSWYKLKIRNNATNEIIFTGSFYTEKRTGYTNPQEYIDNYDEIIKGVYLETDVELSNNIIAGANHDYGADYKFVSNNFTYYGTAITTIPSLDSVYGAVEWSIWIYDDLPTLSYKNSSNVWNDINNSGVEPSLFALEFTSLSGPPSLPVKYPCFKQGSKIRTFKGYKKVEDLRTGDLVKTLRDGFKPIVLIGKSEINHSASKSRIKEQLYKCSRLEYPELTEDLVLTGCHSILVDEFVSEEQKDRVIEVMKNIYVTDNKYRLPACADPRASVYEKPGTYTIYHLALENDDYYMNYGIYANGLLVESCSKRYLKEESNMELVN